MTTVYVAVALVVAYPVIAGILLRLTQGTRDELADLGRDLLAAPNISEDNKQFISDLLDDVFDWRFMAFSCFAFPKFVWEALRGRESICAADQRFLNDPRVNRFFDLHWRAVAAVAPLWAVLFFIIALISIATVIVFVGFSIVNQLWVDTAHHVTERVQHNVPLYRQINGH